MRRFWRGLVIFLIGGVLGTGVRRRARLLRLSVRVSAAGRDGSAQRGRQGEAGRDRHVHPRQSVRSDPLGHAARSASMSARCSSNRISRSGRDRRSTSISCRRPASAKAPISATRCSSISAACAPSRAASATPIPAGVDLKNYPERDHLVPAVQRADLAGGSGGEIGARRPRRSFRLRTLLIAAMAIVASMIGGVAGYGTGALMPLVLVPIVGAEPVVPIIAISALFTNSSRVVRVLRR